MTTLRVGGLVGALVLAAGGLLAVAGGADASTNGAVDRAAGGMTKPTFSPKSGDVGTKVKIEGRCGDIGLGDVIQAVVGFYYNDAFSTAAGFDTFHEDTVKGAKAAGYKVTLKVGPAHKYTTGTGAMPGPEVKHKPKAGDKFRVQTLCYYEGSAFPEYKSAKGKFTVKK